MGVRFLLVLWVITIKQGRAEQGGGLFNRGSTILNQCIVKNNYCEEQGCGIYNKSGTIEFNDCIVSGNLGEEWSCGGICNDSGIITLNDSTVFQNIIVGYSTANELYNNQSGTVTLKK